MEIPRKIVEEKLFPEFPHTVKVFREESGEYYFKLTEDFVVNKNYLGIIYNAKEISFKHLLSAFKIFQFSFTKVKYLDLDFYSEEEKDIIYSYCLKSVKYTYCKNICLNKTLKILKNAPLEVFRDLFKIMGLCYIKSELLFKNIDSLKEIPKEKLNYIYSYAVGYCYFNSIKSIENPNLETQLINIIKHGENSIIDIKKPNFIAQVYAAHNDPELYKYIKNPPPNLQKKMVRKRPHLIKYIQNPSLEIQKIVIQGCYTNIKLIKNPHQDVQMEAVKASVNYIEFINDPCPKVQLYCVKKCLHVYKFIKNPCEEVNEWIINKRFHAAFGSNRCVLINYFPFDEISEELKLKIIKKKSVLIKKFKEQTQEMKEIAIKDNPRLIFYEVKEPSYELCVYALKEKHMIYYHISKKLNLFTKEQQIELQKIALNNLDDNLFAFMKNKSKDIQKFALKHPHPDINKKFALIEHINLEEVFD